MYGAGALRLRSLFVIFATRYVARLEVGSARSAAVVAVLDLELLAVLLREARDERRSSPAAVRLRRELRAAVPVLLGDERLDLALAVDDEPERDALHATGGEPERELRPDERRHVVADDAVEHAPRALRVVEVLVELARAMRRPSGRRSS